MKICIHSFAPMCIGMPRLSSRAATAKKDENWVELSNTLSLLNKCIFKAKLPNNCINNGIRESTW